MLRTKTIFALLCCLSGQAVRSQQQSPTQQLSPAQQQSPTQQLSPGETNQWAWEAISLQQGGHFAHLSKPVKIAIIDDGFDIDNPLWASHIAHNPAEIPGNNIDDDQNGKIDDYEGWDFGDNDEEVRPNPKYLKQESHGTRVLGVFWEVLQQISAGDLSAISILPIKAVSDKKMNNYLKEGYKGIEYAIEQKADIIICSWSGPNIEAEEKAILARARAKGIMIIAAAGNFYSMQPMYPGAIPSVINVAATGRSGTKLKVSNYGSFVDISAPGDSLLTFDPYKKMADAHLSATSAATPVIGAIIAAIRSAYPDLSPETIERIVKNTATPLEDNNPLYAGNLGAGLVNVAAIKEELERIGTRQGGAEANRHEPGGRGLDGHGLVGHELVGHRLVFRQPKAYVNLEALSPGQPVRILPGGKYKNIKFLLQPASYNSAPSNNRGAASNRNNREVASYGEAASNREPAFLPDIRVTLFNEGTGRDTLLKKERLRYPFIVTADSIYLYAGSGSRANQVAGNDRQSGSHQSGNRQSGNRPTTVNNYASYHKPANPETISRPISSSLPKNGPPAHDVWWYYEVTTIDSSTLYCGNTVTDITGNEGFLEDGSGEQNYTGRNDCKWQITVPEGKKIQLSFEEFDTEPKIDQVYIFNGNSTKDPILAIFSGHKLPPSIKSWGNSVLIWFLTSEENNYKGWKLHYKAVD